MNFLNIEGQKWLVYCNFVVWREEVVPPQWREGHIVNLIKKGDKEDPGNYRGITLLSVVGKVLFKILNDRLVQHLDECQAVET